MSGLRCFIFGFLLVLYTSSIAFSQVAPRQFTGNYRLNGGQYTNLRNSAIAAVIGEQHYCSGALVGGREILTTASCAAASPLLGVLIDGEVYQVAQVLSNSAFRPGENDYERAEANVAVIMLNTDVLRVEPLPVLEGKPLVSGDKVTLYGYGNNEEYPQAELLSDLYFLGKSADTRVGRFFNGVFEVLYLENLVGLCPGDQGGPAVAVINGVNVVVGVMAYGDGYIDQYGRCISSAMGRNGIVYLQSELSSRFLANIPRVQRYKYVPPTPAPTPTPVVGVQSTSVPQNTPAAISMAQIRFQSMAFLRRTRLLLKNTSGPSFARRIASLKREVEGLADVSPEPQKSWLSSAVDGLLSASLSRNSAARTSSLKRVIRSLRQFAATY